MYTAIAVIKLIKGTKTEVLSLESDYSDIHNREAYERITMKKLMRSSKFKSLVRKKFEPLGAGTKSVRKGGEEI